jgi:hypothetical protein
MGRKSTACLMRRSRPPGSGCSAKAALASLFSLRCCSLAWRRRRSLRARSQSQAILDQQPCSRRDHRASPSIRGRASTDAARGGISCSIVRRRFQALCGISGCLFRTRARHSPAGKATTPRCGVRRDGAPFQERRAVACPHAQESCTRAPAQSRAPREPARRWRPLDIRQSGRRAAS